MTLPDAVAKVGVVLTSGAKARAIAELAKWLSEVEHRESGDPVAKAIDDAYRALQLSSEVTARNQICALLSVLAQRAAASPVEQRESVRGFIRSIQNSRVFGVECAPRNASDEAIDRALEAWAIRRKPKWKTTSTLLIESGFPRVEPNTLKTGWDRRHG